MAKAEPKGRTREAVDQDIRWLGGYHQGARGKAIERVMHADQG